MVAFISKSPPNRFPPVRVFEFIQGILLGVAATQPANLALLNRKGLQDISENGHWCGRRVWQRSSLDDLHEHRIAMLSDAASMANFRVGSNVSLSMLT